MSVDDVVDDWRWKLVVVVILLGQRASTNTEDREGQGGDEQDGRMGSVPLSAHWGSPQPSHARIQLLSDALKELPCGIEPFEIFEVIDFASLTTLE